MGPWLEHAQLYVFQGCCLISSWSPFLDTPCPCLLPSEHLLHSSLLGLSPDQPKHSKRVLPLVGFLATDQAFSQTDLSLAHTIQPLLKAPSPVPVLSAL